MSKHMETLKDLLCDELDRIASKGELTAGSLDTIDKLTHSIKSIETILAMKEAGYSYNDGMSYDQRGYSGARRNPPRNAIGQYKSYDRGNRGYSRDDGKEWMIEQLEDMMEEAQDHKVREAIKKAIHQIEH